MDAKQAWENLRTKGLRPTAITLISLFAFGVVDHFTGQIIPAATNKIESYLWPLEFALTFTTPVPIDDKQTKITPIPENAHRSVSISRDPHNRWLLLKGDPGLYWVELHREDKKIFLVGELKIDKSKNSEKLDTSESKWAKPASIAKGFAELSPQTDAARARLLKNTRWSLAEADFAQLAQSSDNISKQILFAALNEVGVFEFGSDEEKARIYAYWNVTPTLLKNNRITPNNLGPWGGAFLTWVVSRAGLQPPPLSTAYSQWLGWGSSIQRAAVKPGTIALFATAEVPEVRTGYIAGVVLRVRSECIEIITGNVADRVVITCVELPMTTARR